MSCRCGKPAEEHPSLLGVEMRWVGEMTWRYRLLHAWMALRGFHVG